MLGAVVGARGPQDQAGVHGLAPIPERPALREYQCAYRREVGTRAFHKGDHDSNQGSRGGDQAAQRR